MKTRLVKVLGFFVLNIIFFTILIGFANQAVKPSFRQNGHPINQAKEPFPKTPGSENAAYKTTHQNLIIATAVAELAIN